MSMRKAMRILTLLGMCAVLITPSVVRAEDQSAADKIARGKYLVNLGGCNDCHSPKVMTDKGPMPDESKLMSGHVATEKVPEVTAEQINPTGWIAMCNANMTAWAGPWGVSFASNLTPDKQTGIGDWTEEQFVKALRTGKHRGFGRQIMPPMPWDPIGHSTDEDLSAIFAYLKSLSAVTNKVPDPLPPAGN